MLRSKAVRAVLSILILFIPTSSLRAQIWWGIAYNTQTTYLPIVTQEFDMTQISRPQQGRLVTYPDCGGYTANQWARVFRRLVQDSTTQGVFANYLSEMVVSNPAGVTIRVASGAALVNGHYCFNEDTTDPSVASNVDFAPTTPGADRIDRVVLVQNNTDNVYNTNLEFPTDLTDYAGLSSVPAHSCRLAILTGVSGAAMRALIQNVAVSGNIWMIEIARYTITNAPVISVGPTDYRDYAPKMDTDNIEDLAITEAKIGPLAVTSGKIDTDAVTPDKIPDRTRYLFIPALYSKNTTDGTYDADVKAQQGIEMPDGKVSEVYGQAYVPVDFVSLTNLTFIVRPAATGNIYGTIYYNRGSIGALWSASSLGGGPAAVAVTLNENESIMSTGAVLAPVAGNFIACLYQRDAVDVLDTIGASVYAVGWLMEYTADN